MCFSEKTGHAIECNLLTPQHCEIELVDFQHASCMSRVTADTVSKLLAEQKTLGGNPKLCKARASFVKKLPSHDQSVVEECCSLSVLYFLLKEMYAQNPSLHALFACMLLKHPPGCSPTELTFIPVCFCVSIPGRARARARGKPNLYSFGRCPFHMH